ncbi:polycomb protein Scm-like [Artemia franciscana]|uniref:polycomb protein Scm-like n=1 Tax=Artemia franciscana TaxID=6661 RepID=UPI0032DB256E
MALIPRATFDWDLYDHFAKAFCLANPKFVRSAIEDYIRPVFQHGDIVLEVECGSNNGYMYLSKLCQGSRGACIYYQGSWLTPNEFQFLSGRETAKDWKRSIRHCGKSMKLLLNKGILTSHPIACDCNSCRNSARMNRCRLLNPYASKHRIASFIDRFKVYHSNSILQVEGMAPSINGGKIDTSSRMEENRDEKKGESFKRITEENTDSDSATNDTLLADNCKDSNKLLDKESMAAVPPKHRRKKVSSRASMTMPVKTERASPEIDRQLPTPNGSSRSGSPRSPIDPVFRPSPFPGTPPNVQSGQERLSPPRINSKSEGQMPIRNYSDFMRSLAAKYNSSSSNQPTNDYYAAGRGNYFPHFDPRFSSIKPTNPALLGLNTLGQAAAVAAAIHSKKEDVDKKCQSINFNATGPLLNPASVPMHLLNQASFGHYQMMDMSSTQALLNIVRSASSQSNHSDTRSTPKRNLESPVATSTPLDLSSMQNKKPRLDDSGNDSIQGREDIKSELLRETPVNEGTGDAGSCQGHCEEAAKEMSTWSIETVSTFVANIDLCSEYADVFKEHSIDGTALPLLTDEHLTTKLNMKLGPALKLKSTIAQKLGHCPVCLHCAHCHSSPEKKFFRNNYGLGL